MGQGRSARSWLLAVVAMVTGLAPVVTVARPVAAGHGASFLQVTPEISTANVGSVVTLTARLYNDAALLGRVPGTVPPLGGVTVDFTYAGAPLTSAPARCAIEPGSSTCQVAVSGNVAGVTTVRATIADADADPSEGRLANTAAAERPEADCLSATEGDPPPAVCGAGDPPAPGATAEPDTTDVVRITWANVGLDVVLDDQTRARGEVATLTATAYDVAGNPAPPTLVNFEFFERSVSDPGTGRNTPNIPDRQCVTAAAGRPDAGTCKITFPQAADGVDLLCAWTASAPPAMVGVADTGTCDGEGRIDPTANDGKPVPFDDDQDVVRVVWGSGGGAGGAGRGGGGAPVPVAAGYWLVASDGGIFAFGDANFQGSTGAMKLNQPIVGMAATPSRKGYWLVAADGGIFAFGDARFRGSTGAMKLNQPIVGMAATPSGEGYWLVARDGGIFAFGDAAFRGSTGALKLNRPIVGMAGTATGRGYWLVASDGGIFAFGDATFKGSTGALRLNQPIVGMASTPSAGGYWLVASDGGIFAFGDAAFRGSTGAIKLNQPITGMSRSRSGGGYWLVASDGGIFAFGDAAFKGSTGAMKLNRPVVGMDAL
ncbi:MAG: hypothetical protein M3Q48_17625 [Actinomycetota bacterium]|nr:hypothetical protein [Actinomycetota bacterium]